MLLFESCSYLIRISIIVWLEFFFLSRLRLVLRTNRTSTTITGSVVGCQNERVWRGGQGRLLLLSRSKKPAWARYTPDEKFYNAKSKLIHSLSLPYVLIFRRFKIDLSLNILPSSESLNRSIWQLKFSLEHTTLVNHFTVVSLTSCSFGSNLRNTTSESLKNSVLLSNNSFLKISFRDFCVVQLIQAFATPDSLVTYSFTLSNVLYISVLFFTRRLRNATYENMQ